MTSCSRKRVSHYLHHFLASFLFFDVLLLGTVALPSFLIDPNYDNIVVQRHFGCKVRPGPIESNYAELVM